MIGIMPTEEELKASGVLEMSREEIQAICDRYAEESYQERKEVLRDIINRLCNEQLSKSESEFIIEIKELMGRVEYQTLEELPQYARDRLSYMLVIHRIDMTKPFKSVFYN